MGYLHCIRVTKGAPIVSYFFFADDSLFYFKATRVQCEVVKSCFQVCEEASSQQINFQ